MWGIGNRLQQDVVALRKVHELRAEAVIGLVEQRQQLGAKGVGIQPQDHGFDRPDRRRRH